MELTSMTKYLGPLTIAVIAVGLMGPEAFAQAPVPVQKADLKIATANDAAADEVRKAFAAEEALLERHEMSLTPDGNVPGSLKFFDDSGTLTPARVRLYFVQKGQVVSQSLPNEQGEFQASGLQPGIYSMVAAGQSGFAAVGIRILPPPDRPEAPKANTIGRAREVSNRRAGQLMLNLAMINPSDVLAAFQIAQRENAGGIRGFPGFAPGAAPGAPFGGGPAGGGGAAGGGGGGFGRLGGLFVAGAAGAAGFAAGRNGGSGTTTTSASPNGSGS
jgi:hypothetical protein